MSGDAQALFDALHADRSDADAWRAGLEARTDVDGFLHWLALNAVVQDWDVYGRMSHNYYLYADPDDGGCFQWIPWDHSFAFTSQGGFGEGQSLGMDDVSDLNATASPPVHEGRVVVTCAFGHVLKDRSPRAATPRRAAPAA